MRPFLVLILILSFALQSFGTVWLYVDYKVNLDKYAKNCINKARPVLQCNGKCQLAKKIQAEEQKKQKDAEKGAPKLDYNLSSKHFFLLVEPVKHQGCREYSTQLSTDEVRMPRSIFRPPCN